MPLILSEEAQMVRETALDFFRERSPITALRKLRDDKDPDGFSRGLWRQMAELGWTGFLVAEDDGELVVRLADFPGAIEGFKSDACEAFLGEVPKDQVSFGERGVLSEVPRFANREVAHKILGGI